MGDVASVGGKNASLGEMLHHLTELGVRVPGGFATTTDAYYLFMKEAGLEERVHDALTKLDVRDVHALTRVGREIRAAVETAELPNAVRDAIADAYGELDAALSFAVRSSATAEDTADASFAGQHETYLNVRGLSNIQLAVKKVYASLFNDRAIAYRVHHGFEHKDVGISAGVQQMV